MGLYTFACTSEVSGTRQAWLVVPYIVLHKILVQVSKPEKFQIGEVKIDDERVSDELLMSSNL